ncbi:MAG TPA: cadherin [Prolixibacteraceae bacterium]|nr:cadherin [Prolixibacteraceae bacterium]
MKFTHLLVFLSASFLVINVANCQTANKLIPFASGLISPVSITNAGDKRLFVAEQRGYIRILSSTGTINSQPFLNITNRVVYGAERGLLGIAFHPKYSSNGFFYVNYIGKGDSTHISRFTVSTGDPNVADPQSELKLMTIFQPYQNHNGGDLKFGPDGYLYIGMGDGGSGGDPGNRAQNPKELLGKMLRIDVDHGNPYSIPSSNPFYNSNTARGEIWSLGLRNPWRFSFDRLTGDLWIADVGQSTTEEIDFQPAGSKGGENYGWRCYEGNKAYNSGGCGPLSSFTFPVFSYAQGQECSVTGGFVYRGSTKSPFYGHYFFTDYCSDRIWTLHKVAGNWVKEDFGQFSGNNFSTFGEGADGQIYVAGLSSGKLFRVSDQVTESRLINKPIDFKVIQIPFSDLIRIETEQIIDLDMQISVYDLKGIKRFQGNTTESSYEFNPGFLTSGIYLLSVRINRNNQVRKLVLGNNTSR